MRHIPLLLTLIRFAASPLLVYLLLASKYQTALGATLVAGVTDWLDGFSARKLGVSGQLGVVLDPLADKAMLVSLFLVLGWIGLLPAWMIFLVMGRDVVILVGAALLRWFRGYRKFLPSTLGKVSTFFQIVLVLLVLVRAAFPGLWLARLTGLALILSAIFTGLSWADYVRRGLWMERHPLASQPERAAAARLD